METPEAEGGRTVGPLGGTLPQTVTRRALTTRLEAPDRFKVGRRTPFRFHVRNRLPLGVVLTLPTSRRWGWAVDDRPEAGAGRYDPPEVATDLAFGPRERRTFTGYWDGRIRRETSTGVAWDAVTGSVELRTYLAVDRGDDYGLSETVTVPVVDPDRQRH